LVNDNRELSERYFLTLCQWGIIALGVPGRFP